MLEKMNKKIEKQGEEHKIAEQTCNIIHNICEKYEKRYKIFDGEFNKANNNPHFELVDDILFSLALKQCDKKTQLLHKKDTCQINGNKNISKNGNSKNAHCKFQETNTVNLSKIKEQEEVRTNIIKPNIHKKTTHTSLKDTNDISNQSYFKNVEKLNKNKNYVKQLKSILDEFSEFIQEQKNLKKKMTILLTKIETKMTDITKDEDNVKKILLKEKKDFRRILEKYLDEIENIYIQIQKYDYKCKLDSDGQLGKNQDSEIMCKEQTSIIKNAPKLSEPNKQQCVKRMVIPFSRDEGQSRDKLLINKDIDVEHNVKNPDIDHHQHDLNPTEVVENLNIVQNEISQWNKNNDANKAALQKFMMKKKAELKSKSLVGTATEFEHQHELDTMQQILKLKNREIKHTFEKTKVLPNLCNTSREIASEKELIDLEKNCNLSVHNNSQDNSIPLENEKEIMITMATTKKLDKTSNKVIELSKHEQEPESFSKNCVLYDLREDSNEDKIVGIKGKATESMKSVSTVVIKQIETEGKKIDNKTKAKEQTDSLKQEFLFWDPYSGLQKSFTVQGIEQFIINGPSRKRSSNDSYSQKNIKKIIIGEGKQIKFDKGHDKIKFNKQKKLLELEFDSWLPEFGSILF